MALVDKTSFPFSHEHATSYERNISETKPVEEIVDKINLTVDSKERPIDLKDESDRCVCQVALEHRVGQGGTVPWFQTQRAWVRFPANIKFKYLGLLIEMAMGCWPGWTFHTGISNIVQESAEDSSNPHAMWTFVRAVRVASPLFDAPLKPLTSEDWVFECDRITFTLQRIYVPSWLKNDPQMYYVASLLWKFVPDPEHDRHKTIRYDKIERILFPFERAYPYLSSSVSKMVAEMKKLLAPSSIAHVPLYDMIRPFTQHQTDEWVLGDIPGVIDRFMGMRHTIPELARLTRDEAEHRLFLGTRRKQTSVQKDNESMDQSQQSPTSNEIDDENDPWLDESAHDSTHPNALQLIAARNRVSKNGSIISWDEWSRLSSRFYPLEPIDRELRLDKPLFRVSGESSHNRWNLVHSPWSYNKIRITQSTLDKHPSLLIAHQSQVVLVALISGPASILSSLYQLCREALDTLPTSCDQDANYLRATLDKWISIVTTSATKARIDKQFVNPLVSLTLGCIDSTIGTSAWAIWNDSSCWARRDPSQQWNTTIESFDWRRLLWNASQEIVLFPDTRQLAESVALVHRIPMSQAMRRVQECCREFMLKDKKRLRAKTDDAIKESDSIETFEHIIADWLKIPLCSCQNINWCASCQVGDRWHLFPVTPPNRVEFNNREPHQVLVATRALVNPQAETSTTKLLADALFEMEGDSAICTIMGAEWPSISVLVLQVE